jgi:hypothetical protein
VTTADWGDSEVFRGLLDQVDGEVPQVSADGAYDTKGCHAAIADRDGCATIPPRDGAVPWGDDHPRDGTLQDIDAKGSAGWKNDSGYHRRSLAENMVYRLKQLGDSLYSRTFEPRVTEAHVRAAIINTFYLSGHAAIRRGWANCACRTKYDEDRGSSRPKRLYYSYSKLGIRNSAPTSDWCADYSIGIRGD